MTPSMLMAAYITLLVILVVFSGFFSASETALTGASRARIHALANDGNRRATKVARLQERMEKVISTVLLGNTLMNALTASLMTTIFGTYFGESGYAPLVAAVAATIFLFIFAEVMPKTYAINHADRYALAAAPLLSFLVRLTYPLTHVTQAIVSGTLRMVGIKVISAPGAEESLEELRGAIDLHSESAEEIREANAMLHSILDLDEVPVSDIMVHRRQMVMIDIGLPVAEIIRQVLASPHTRVPLWHDEPDNIVGVLHAKALLRALQANDWKVEGLDLGELAAKPWFIPDSTSLLAQLEAFRSRREHFAIVVDEYGALMGIVTLEDILEEIVGDIADEHDVSVEGVHRDEDGSYVVDGRVTIRDLNREFDWRLPDEEASTVAGLVLHEARQIPLPGQVFVFYGFSFEILERQRNQITKLRMIPLKLENEGETGDAPSSSLEAAARTTTASDSR
ncbi:MAG TPA: HlyC/CorC family transporter [Terriglobia bacterium]|nr:HlyC/CorC family transporter [Terriglobia bacterium]